MEKTAEELIDENVQLFREFDDAITEMSKRASENEGFTITRRKILESLYDVMDMSKNKNIAMEALLKQALKASTKKASTTHA